MNSENLHLQQSIRKAFQQVETALESLEPEQYSLPSRCLFNATIGQHVRHIIELFIELDKGYETGTVNYEKRKRDYRIETDKDFAVSLLSNIYNEMMRPNKPLLLEAGYKEDCDELITMETNYYRELAYNMEHTVHHMALIRIGINELSAVPVDESFGIASSTIKYRSSCAQ
jgi:uncharacterized damage-inducible protein DinB